MTPQALSSLPVCHVTWFYLGFLCGRTFRWTQLEQQHQQVDGVFPWQRCALGRHQQTAPGKTETDDDQHQHQDLKQPSVQAGVHSEPEGGAVLQTAVVMLC